MNTRRLLVTALAAATLAPAALPPERAAAAANTVRIERVTVAQRLIRTRVHVGVPGRLVLLLVSDGSRSGMGAADLATPLTVTLSYRVPRRVRAGRYRVLARLTPAAGGRRAESSWVIRLR